MKHPVTKNQLGDFCPFHRCLNEDEVAEEGRELVLTGQFHHGSQEMVLPGAGEDSSRTVPSDRFGRLQTN